MMIDLKRSIDQRWLLKSGATFILMILFVFALMMLIVHNGDDYEDGDGEGDYGGHGGIGGGGGDDDGEGSVALMARFM